ncbi:MAG: response regulator [Bacteroidia bacterium]|nr:response regulator [Bacteroidia bacterium]MCC7533308.1 response regulator [Bacteroidia bacterium]
MVAPTDKIKIIYVDDEENNLLSFKATFRTKYDVLTAINAEEAIKLLEQHPDIAVIITDQRMPNITGVEFLQSIIEKYPLPVRILLTGYTDINALIEAVNLGKIHHYLSKPWSEEELDKCIIEAHSQYLKRKTEIDFNDKLLRSNDQLEFLLRQKLLS